MCSDKGCGTAQDLGGADDGSTVQGSREHRRAGPGARLDPFREPPAPEGAPNVLLVLYDDTGLAAWSPYGGRINMPTMQKLADNGLTYTQWHTTALCSPTRSCLLTGRNHHQNGFAQIAEGAGPFAGRGRRSACPPRTARPYPGWR